MAKPDIKLLFLLASVFILSASALAYEILLMRLFAIIQWHHFAYMIIGLALLGYGVSGTVVSLFQQRVKEHFFSLYVGSVFMFSVFSVLNFQVAQQLPFNAELIFWDDQQLFLLTGMLLLLSVPFFFAATAICIAFMHFKAHLTKIYAADLIGAAAGSLGLIILLFFLLPQHALITIASVSVFAAILVLPSAPKSIAKKLLLLAIPVAVFIGYQLTQIKLEMSPYKSLSQTLKIQGATIIHQRSSPLGLLSVIENNSVPFRHAPGLSINTDQMVLPQLALFTDGDSHSAITQFPDKIKKLSYLSNMTSALPYAITPIDSALIVGGAGGTDILQALYHDTKSIDVLELNKQTYELVDKVLADFSGSPYSHKKVNTHIREVRDFLGSSDKKYSLIQISLMDGFNASSSGMHSLNESYLYTIEAIQLYLSHLKDNGYLAITRWINIPPRDSLKLFHSMVIALKEQGFKDIGKRIVFIRSWQTGTILIKNAPFSDNELKMIRSFNENNAFDSAWLPDMRAAEANRFNMLSSPIFYEASSSILSDEKRDQFIRDYKFDLQPSTDNKPFFHHFFRWQTFSELLELRDQGGMPLIEWGYLVLLATLVISVISSFVLILIPLIFFQQKATNGNISIRKINVIFYFFMVGLAFLMIEIAFMQKFIVLLHHPIYSFAATLSIFLLFAGLGSHVGGRLAAAWSTQRVFLASCLGIALIGIVYLWLLDPLFEVATGFSLPVKIFLSIILLAPLAFLMGMPFPMGLASLSQHAENYIPWAWGINGCASVISASLSTILAINLGFNAVIGIGLALYLTTLVFFPSPKLAERPT
ncbi:MAG: SAM-dependent methyltransferase [Gammaproteobacteria bacterium]